MVNTNKKSLTDDIIVSKNGVFTIELDGRHLEVMFMRDFYMSQNKTSYKTEREDVLLKLKSKTTRSSTLVVVNSKQFEDLQTQEIGDKQGRFNLVLDGEIRKAAMVADYSFYRGLTKQAAIRRMRSKRFRVQKGIVKRATSNRHLTLVIFGKGE